MTQTHAVPNNLGTIPSLSKLKYKQKKHPKDKNPQHQISTENQEINETHFPKPQHQISTENQEINETHFPKPIDFSLIPRNWKEKLL